MNPQFENNIPIYLQIAEEIKMDIVSGVYKPGERLPSVREWSLQMRVNPNTMQKALSELEDLGLVYTERTNGKFVSLDEKLISRFKKELAEKMSFSFFEQMKKIGFDEKEALLYLESRRGEKE